MPQFSDLPTKAFLGSTGAAANSYVLINYAENQQNTPVTYKATIEELSKAIVSNKRLIQMNDSDTICTVTVRPSRQTYTADDSHYILTKDEHTFLQDIKENTPWASMGYINTEIYNATDGLASTGYVTDAITSALGNSPGGTGTINLTDSYPFANTSGLLPASFTESSPKSLLVFAPFGSDMVGPPYIQLPGENTATAVNLAGPYVIKTSNDTTAECYNLFLTTGDICTFDTSSMAPTPVDPRCAGNFISKAEIVESPYDLHPLFIDTNNNTLYYFDNENENWQAVSL